MELWSLFRVEKFDAESNPFNRVVGSKVNAYIHLEFLLNWRLDAQTGLRAGIAATHFSNGNTGYPNAGVNTVGASVGITRYFGGSEKTECACTFRRPAFKPYLSYDLIVYGSTRKRGCFWKTVLPFWCPVPLAFWG